MTLGNNSQLSPAPFLFLSFTHYCPVNCAFSLRNCMNKRSFLPKFCGVDLNEDVLSVETETGLKRDTHLSTHLSNNQETETGHPSFHPSFQQSGDRNGTPMETETGHPWRPKRDTHGDRNGTPMETETGHPSFQQSATPKEVGVLLLPHLLGPGLTCRTTVRTFQHCQEVSGIKEDLKVR